MTEGPGTLLKITLQSDIEILSRISPKLGSRLDNPATLEFIRCISETANFLDTASSRPAPTDDDQLEELVAPILSLLESVCEMKDGVSENDLLRAHITTMSEAVQAFAFVCVPPEENVLEPIESAKSAMADSLKAVQQKGKKGDSMHTEWAGAIESIVEKLHAFVKENYPTGIKWGS